MDQNIKLQLHDIKTIVEVEEYSLYYSVILSVIGVLILSGAIYLLIKWFKNRKRYNKRKEYFKALKDIDLSDTKKAAYAITHYGGLYKEDSQRHEEMFLNISKRLEAHKYKKEVESFDEETLGYIELYKEMIDV